MFKKLIELRQQKAEKVAEMRAMLDKAEKENLSGKREYVDIENELQQMIEEYKNTHNK